MERVLQNPWNPLQILPKFRRKSSVDRNCWEEKLKRNVLTQGKAEDEAAGRKEPEEKCPKRESAEDKFTELGRPGPRRRIILLEKYLSRSRSHTIFNLQPLNFVYILKPFF